MSNDRHWRAEWWLLAIPAAVALGAIATYALTFQHLPATENPGAWGTFGDFIGGLLNPLISALTLFVAIGVWQLQKKEVEATKKALQEQAKTAEQQRQEQRFFDLLNVYQQTVESITHIETRQMGHQETHRFGKQAMTAWVQESEIDQPGPRIPSNSDFFNSTIKDSAGTQWGHFDDSGLFDHYFRVIFHILSEAETLLGDQHIRYIKLFRAQLSRSELIILGSNLWRDVEGKKIAPLAEKYGLLKHLPKGQLRTELEKLHPKVFGRSQAHSPPPSSQPEPESTPC